MLEGLYGGAQSLNKVCILGNSHIAAIALGWREIAHQHPDVTVTFFGLPRDLLLGLEVVDGVLRTSNEQLTSRIELAFNGLGYINPASYDAFVLCGLRFGINPILASTRTHWAESHKPHFDRAPMSDACFLEAGDAALRQTPAFKIAERIQTVTDKPIAILPTPFIVQDAMTKADAKLQIYINAVLRGDDGAIAEQFAHIVQAMQNPSLRIVQQPPETLASPLLTKSEMGRCYTKSSSASTDDLGHMNAAYGAAMIEAYLT